jgi:hypothetical protein
LQYRATDEVKHGKVPRRLKVQGGIERLSDMDSGNRLAHGFRNQVCSRIQDYEESDGSQSNKQRAKQKQL